MSSDSQDNGTTDEENAKVLEITIINRDECLIVEYFRQNPDKNYCHIYCPCPHCNPHV